MVRVLEAELGGDTPYYSVGPLVRVRGAELGGDAPYYSVGLLVRVLGREVGGNLLYYSADRHTCFMSNKDGCISGVMHTTPV